MRKILWIKIELKMKHIVQSFFCLCLLSTIAVNAQTLAQVSEIESKVIPVYEGGIDRPHHVIGQIDDNLRKPFGFLPNPSKEKILSEIRERARKMGADAVINFKYGETKRTLFNHGRTPISGTAIKFIDN